MGKLGGVGSFEIPGLEKGIMFKNRPFKFDYSKEYGIKKKPDCCTLIKEVNLTNFNNVLESLLANIYNYKYSFLQSSNISDFSEFENSILYSSFNF